MGFRKALDLPQDFLAVVVYTTGEEDPRRQDEDYDNRQQDDHVLIVPFFDYTFHMLKHAYQAGQKAALEKFAAGFNLAPLLQRVQQGWQGLNPQARHAIIGAGIGGLGSKLVGGDFLPGAAVGGSAGYFGGQGISNLMQGRDWGGAIRAGSGVNPLQLAEHGLSG